MAEEPRLYLVRGNTVSLGYVGSLLKPAVGKMVHSASG